MIKVDQTDWASDAQIDEINAQLPLWRLENLSPAEEERTQIAISRRHPMSGAWFSEAGRNAMYRFKNSKTECLGGYFIYDARLCEVKNVADQVVATVRLIDGATVELTEVDALLFGPIISRYFISNNEALRILIAFGRQGETYHDVIRSLEGGSGSAVLAMIDTVSDVAEVGGEMVMPKASGSW